jgi:hypothetical protein
MRTRVFGRTVWPKLYLLIDVRANVGDDVGVLHDAERSNLTA